MLREEEVMKATEILYFLNNIRDVLITEIREQYWKKQSYSYIDRPRGGYGLMLLIDGNIKFVFDGGELNAKAGDLIFLPKNSCYEAVFEDVSRDFLVNFDVFGNALPIENPTRIYSNTPLEIYKTFGAFVEGNCLGNIMSLKSRAEFYLLIDKILKNDTTVPTNGIRAIEKAKQMLTDTCDHSIEEIAKSCNMSETGLRRKFKETEGMTLVEYRIRKNIQKAMYLLEATDATISEISDELNFYDTAYFCRMFKKIVGVSPKQFVKSKKM